MLMMATVMRTTATAISAVKSAEDELRPLPLGWTGAWPQGLNILWKLAGLLPQ